MLRLPACHCQLNLIELIWAQIKEDVRKKNSKSSQTLKAVESLTKSAIERVTRDNRQQCVTHTRKIEEEYIRQHVSLNHVLESLVIHLSDESSSDFEEDLGAL